MKKFFIFIILIFIGLFFFFNYKLNNAFVNRVKSTLRQNTISMTTHPVTFLIMGVDGKDNIRENTGEVGGSRTDSLILGVFDVKTMRMKTVSIPRDTLVTSNCNMKQTKITEVFADGLVANNNDRKLAAECVSRTVESLTGLPVDYYGLVNFTSFMKIIDMLGGIELKSSATFCEQDSSDKKDSYCFEKGKTYIMDGEMALSYSRNRSADSDFQRGLRQQEVVSSIINQSAKTLNLVNSISILNVLLDSILTNASLGEITKTLNNVKKEFKSKNSESLQLKNYRIYGQDYNQGTYYFIPFRESLDQVKNSFELILKSQYKESENLNDVKYPNKDVDTNFIEYGTPYITPMFYE